MFNTYKVIYEITEEKNGKPFTRTYCFSCQGGKRQAMKIANDILVNYIIDMGFYVGSIRKISEVKTNYSPEKICRENRKIIRDYENL